MLTLGFEEQKFAGEGERMTTVTALAADSFGLWITGLARGI